MIDQQQIREALASGLEPIVVYKRPVFSSNGDPEPIAYRTETVLNSTISGTLTPDDYRFTSDKSKRGILLSDRTLESVCEAIDAMPEGDRSIKWISLSCPVSMITNTDLIETLDKTFGGDKEKRKKLMLEFPATILYKEDEIIRQTLLDMKLIGVKSALVGYGNEYCPMLRLSSLPFDYVILDERVRELMKSDQKAAETLISFARNLRVDVVATGIEDPEEEAPLFYRADCFGYTLAKSEKERLLPECEIELTPDALTTYYVNMLKEKEEREQEQVKENEPNDGRQ